MQDQGGARRQGALFAAGPAAASAAEAGASGRVPALESIRGLGALQVLLLHVCSAYAPTLAYLQTPWTLADYVHFSPLFLFYDGHAAVYVFFVLSGLVLTSAFERFADRPFALAGGRVLRLAVPCVAAVAFAMVVKAIFGWATKPAGIAIGLGFLPGVWRTPPGMTYFLYDAFVQAPFVGYSKTSFFSFVELPFPLYPDYAAYVTPLWTLSVEMQGSFLLLALVVCARLNRLLWKVVVCATMIFFCRTYFLCFLVGHLLATTNFVAWLRHRSRVAIVAFAAVGVLLCVIDEIPGIALIMSCQGHEFGWLPCSPRLAAMVGALLLFLAALGSEVALRVLGSRPLAALGRISFPLYLTHWPIVCGASAAVYLGLARLIGDDWARASAGVAAIAFSLFAALAFSPIDRWAIGASRRFRDSATTIRWAGELPPRTCRQTNR